MKQACLELTMWPSETLDFWSSSLYLLRAGMTGVCYHAGLVDFLEMLYLRVLYIL